MTLEATIKARIAALPALSVSGLPEKSWAQNRHTLRQHMLREPLANFRNWAVIQATILPSLELQQGYLRMWESHTGKQVSDLETIVEFGGGYGLMVQAAHAIGFDGVYYSYDFPEMLALQEYYLSTVDVPNPLPLPDEGSFDLFIAVCSLSEAPLVDRRRVFQRREFKHVLIKYQQRFNGIDNMTEIDMGEVVADEHNPNHLFQFG